MAKTGDNQPLRPDPHLSDQLLLDLFEQVPEARLAPLYDRHGLQTDDGTAALVSEITRDGANTIMSVIRKGQGVPYEVIVRDVAAKMKVRFSSADSVSEVELKLLEELIQRYLSKASPEERERIQQVLNRVGRENCDVLRSLLKGGFSAGTMAFLVQQIGKKAVAEIVNVIVFQTIARKAATEAAKRAAQVAGWAIPFLNAVLIGWTIVDLAGPAFRRTIPTVLEVALLRLEYGDEVE